MKYSHFYKKKFTFIVCIFIIFLFSSFAKANIEDDIKEITSKLRCMTCQNQTVFSSDAEFSLTIKEVVKEKLKNNKSEEEIINFLIYRYGEYIVFEPRFNIQNLFLWLFPFIILALSLVLLTLRIKRNK